MSGGNFSLSTVSLKSSFLVSIVVLTLQVSGFFLTQWSHFNLKPASKDITYDFYTGLWKDCYCATFKGVGVCYGTRKGHTSGLFAAVQALETIGLIGIIISGIVTCLVLFTIQQKALKIINIAIVFGSGVCMAIGVAVYAANCIDEYDIEASVNFTDVLNHTPDKDTSELSTSFFLCTIAGILCLLGCTTLLLVDLRTSSVPSQDEQQLPATPVHFSDQGQISPAQGQAVTKEYATPVLARTTPDSLSHNVNKTMFSIPKRRQKCVFLS